MGVPSRHGDPREDNGEALPYPRQEPTPAPRRPAPAVLPVPSQPQWGSPEHNWDRPPPTAIGVSTRAARVDPAPGALPARVQPQWRPPRAQLGCPPPLRHDRTPDPRPPPPAARVHPAPGAIPARFQQQWPPPGAQLGPPPIPATTRFPTRAARLRPAPGALPVRCPPSPRAPGEPRPHARFQESLWDLAPAAR